MPATRDFTATLHLQARPQSVTLDGKAVTDYHWSDVDSAAIVKIPACGKSPRVVVCE